MRLGIDFGTTRIVVAAADRGNYPLVSFDAGEDSAAEWFPPLIALRGDELLYGWDAWSQQADESWTTIRSVKRLLEDAGPKTVLEIGNQRVAVIDLLNGLVGALADALRLKSNLRPAAKETLEVVLGVPAHANSNQRFLTVDAFRKNGFSVLGVLNEPSAASIEFGHREKQSRRSKATILVYDFGGGTFDASLVTLDDGVHHVVKSEGIATIGGDDFDHLLADLALDLGGVGVSDRDDIPAASWFRLLEECRTRKEALNPNSRRISIDLEVANPGWPVVQVPVHDFYEAARALVEETLDVAEQLIGDQSGELEALYLTGGASELPLVARVLKDRFGRRVRRSAHTRSATAIGLAIQADQPKAYPVNERLPRSLGVWRELDSGESVAFDILFERGTSLPSVDQPPLTIRREYVPAHNVGHFRFLECSHRDEHGVPTGEMTVWEDVYFPFDPQLQDQEDLPAVPVRSSASAHQQMVEERFECDASGSLQFVIANRTSGYERRFQLGTSASSSQTMKPLRRRRADK